MATPAGGGEPIFGGLVTAHEFAFPQLVNDEGLPSIPLHTISYGARSIATRGDSVYAVWADKRTSPYIRVYFSKSSDRGATWGPNVLVSDPSGHGIMPSLAVSSQGKVFVAWEDASQFYWKVRFSRSLDGGSTFLPSVWVGWSLGSVSVGNDFSCLAITGEDSVFVAFMASGTGIPTRVYSTRSTDGGASFDTTRMVSNRPVIGRPVAIAATTAGGVAVAWEDGFDSGPMCGFEDPFCGLRIYLARSLDGGVTFLPAYPGTPLFGPAYQPALEFAPNGDLCLAWCGQAIRDAAEDIYFTRNPSDAWDYGSPGVVQVDGAQRGLYPQDTPSLAFEDAGNPVLVWRDTRNGDHDIYFARSGDGGLGFEPAVRVNPGPDSLANPSVAVSPGNLIQVAWDQPEETGGADRLAARGWAAGATGVSSAPAMSSLRAAPNPTAGPVILSWAQAGSSGGSGASIYEPTGRLVARVPGAAAENGRVHARWDLRDAAGGAVAPGIYFVRPDAEPGAGWGRIVVVR